MKIFLAISTLLLLLSAGAKDIVPRQRYRAEFKIAATARTVPVLDLRAMGVKADYCGVQFQFLDRRGKLIRPIARGSFFNVHSREFVPGCFEFYAPDGAAKLRWRCKGAKLRDLRIVPVKNDANLVIPLDHRRSGNIRDYCFTVHPDGTTVYDITDGKIYGDPFPVQAGRTYQLQATGFGNSVVTFNFLRTDRSSRGIPAGKPWFRLQGLKSRTLKYTFIPPKGTKWMRVCFQRGEVSGYSVKEIKTQK